MNRARQLVQLIIKLNPQLAKKYQKVLLKLIEKSISGKTKGITGVGSRTKALKDYMNIKRKLSPGMTMGEILKILREKTKW